ncbi:MAG: orotidine-5'-phosphate decarboxylase [Acidimicrobiia bacterium]|nr:orotidine-5'-phosphate decarboxylase [Acidimicrobiia bacterium]
MTAPETRDRLVLALDMDELPAALALAERLNPWFGAAKVGLELFAAAGHEAYGALHDVGLRVFADMKLHDIPTTVERAARVHGRNGVDFLNFHAAGGVEMLQAGVRGLREGASQGGHPDPIALGVTVLTSESSTDAFAQRLAWAREAGCDGVVCAAAEVSRAHDAKLRTMVPGIRLAGQDLDDQARAATPDVAIANGADWLVIGRAVTKADDPESVAASVHESVDNARRAHS